MAGSSARATSAAPSKPARSSAARTTAGCDASRPSAQYAANRALLARSRSPDAIAARSASTVRFGCVGGIWKGTPKNAAHRCMSSRFMRAFDAGMCAAGKSGVPIARNTPPRRNGLHRTVAPCRAHAASTRSCARYAYGQAKS